MIGKLARACMPARAQYSTARPQGCVVAWQPSGSRRLLRSWRQRSGGRNVGKNRAANLTAGAVKSTPVVSSRAFD